MKMGEIREIKKESENIELKKILELANSGSKIAQTLLGLKNRISIIRKYSSETVSRIEIAKKVDAMTTEELLNKLEESKEVDYKNDPILYNTMLDRLFFRALEQYQDSVESEL